MLSTTISVVPGGTVIINVLANVDGIPDPANLQILSNPVHGTVDIDPPRVLIIYTADQAYAGDDRFRYQVCDATSSSTCAVGLVRVVVGLPQTSAVASARTLVAPSLPIWAFWATVTTLWALLIRRVLARAGSRTR